MNNLRYQQYASFKLSWIRPSDTDYQHDENGNVGSAADTIYEDKSWQQHRSVHLSPGVDQHSLGENSRKCSPQPKVTCKEMSGAEEDDLTADLLQIHRLLHRVMQRQNLMMDQENYAVSENSTAAVQQ